MPLVISRRRASPKPSLSRRTAAEIATYVALVTDYRFRGTTQTNEKGAVQATVNVNTAVGFYVGTWSSSIDGGTYNSTPALTQYGDVEWDLYGGFTKTLSNGLGVDVGLLYYYYPGGAKGKDTDFFEPYAAVTYTVGPVGLKGGAAYAWGGQKGLSGFDISSDNGGYGNPNCTRPPAISPASRAA